MKKSFCILILLCLCASLVSGCAPKSKNNSLPSQQEQTKDSTEQNQFMGYTFNVPADWEAEGDTEDILYFYPEDAMLMIAYSAMNQSISDEQTRCEFLAAFGSSMESYELISENTEQIAETTAYRDVIKIGMSGQLWDTDLVTFDCENGVISFMMAVSDSSDIDYTDKFNDILASITPLASESASSGQVQESSDPETIMEKVDVNVMPTTDGLMCAFITNNSEVTIDELSVQINYKDNSGSTIDMDEDGHDMVLPGATVVSRMEAPDQYADYEVQTSVELGVHKSYENHAKEIDLKSNQGDECIIIEITNNADVDIDELEYVAVLYSDNEIVTVEYPQDVYDVASGSTITEKIDTYGEQYDRFEIYLNQAHTFGF